MKNNSSAKFIRIFLVFSCLLAIGFSPISARADEDTPEGPQAPAVDVLIVVVPAAINVNVGSSFSVKVQIQSGTQLVDAAQASLNFDQTKLSVTSLTGNTTAFPDGCPKHLRQYEWNDRLRSIHRLEFSQREHRPRNDSILRPRCCTIHTTHLPIRHA